jgi:hypothetical protein
MSGRMTEGCRKETETLLGSYLAPPNLFVDLTDVTYIDRAGEETLRWLGHFGARFKADNAYALHICERLHLSMAEPNISSEQPSYV